MRYIPYKASCWHWKVDTAKHWHFPAPRRAQESSDKENHHAERRQMCCKSTKRPVSIHIYFQHSWIFFLPHKPFTSQISQGQTTFQQLMRIWQLSSKSIFFSQQGERESKGLPTNVKQVTPSPAQNPKPRTGEDWRQGWYTILRYSLPREKEHLHQSLVLQPPGCRLFS